MKSCSLTESAGKFELQAPIKLVHIEKVPFHYQLVKDIKVITTQVDDTTLPALSIRYYNILQMSTRCIYFIILKKIQFSSHGIKAILFLKQ